MSVLSGDWRNVDEVEVFPPEHVDDDEVLAWFSVDSPLIKEGLLPSTWPIFPAHRWTKSNVAVTEGLLMASIHGILHEAWPVWTKGTSQSGNKSKNKKQPASEAAADTSDISTPAVASAADTGYDSPDEGAQQADHSGGAGMALVADADPSAFGAAGDQRRSCLSAESLTRFNERMKGNAGGWAKTKPRDTLAIGSVLMNKVMSPWLSSALYKSSNEWLRRNDEETLQGRPREFRLLESFKALPESVQSHAVWKYVCEASEWTHLISPVGSTKAMRSLAYRQLMTGAAANSLYLWHPSQVPPYSFFPAVEDKALLTRVWREFPPCMMGSFSALLQKQHSISHEHEQRDLWVKLYGMCEFGRDDNCHIECGQGAIQKECRSKGLQCVAVDVASMSAWWLQFTVHRDGDKGRHWCVTQPKKCTQFGRPKKARRRRRLGRKGQQNIKRAFAGCGAWTVFVMDRSSGLKRAPGQNVFAGLSAEYRNLSLAEREEYRRRGALWSHRRSVLGKGALTENTHHSYC